MTGAKVVFGALPHWLASANGDGSGYGDGFGSGYGSGDGSGSGYGSGHGYGSGYWLAIFDTKFLSHPRVQELLKAEPEVSFAYWRSNKRGFPSNGGSSDEAARPGLVQEIAGPLKICTPRALHGTLDPEKWKGDRLWLVALIGECQHSEDKRGALRREIIEEVIL